MRVPLWSFWCKYRTAIRGVGVVFELATAVDAFECFDFAVVGGARVSEHGLGIVEVGDRGREMRLAGQKDAFEPPRICTSPFSPCYGAVIQGGFSQPNDCSMTSPYWPVGLAKLCLDAKFP